MIGYLIFVMFSIFYFVCMFAFFSVFFFSSSSVLASIFPFQSMFVRSSIFNVSGRDRTLHCEPSIYASTRRAFCLSQTEALTLCNMVVRPNIDPHTHATMAKAINQKRFVQMAQIQNNTKYKITLYTCTQQYVVSINIDIGISYYSTPTHRRAHCFTVKCKWDRIRPKHMCHMWCLGKWIVIFRSFRKIEFQLSVAFDEARTSLSQMGALVP